MTTRIILVRHGQSTGNAKNCFTGQTDVELSPLGRQQAQLTARALAHEQLTAVYTSDLQRAYRTAEPIAALHNLPVQRTDQLREIDLGDFHGRSFEEVARDFPTEFAALSRRDPDVTMPGGESHRAVRTRVIRAFEQIINAHLDGTILIVVHGGVIFHINHYILGIPEERSFSISYKIGNCSIHRHELLADNRWRIVALNDIAHLRELERAGLPAETSTDFHAISEKLFGCS